MPIIVNSPYSGRPVKIRDQDINRAIRDEEKRIFYVIARRDGKGFYSSPTRHGSPKDEQRYLEMEAKINHARDVGADQSQKQILDATGKRRSGLRGKLFILLLIGVICILAYLFTIGPLSKIQWKKPPTPSLEKTLNENEQSGNPSRGI